MQPPTRQRFKNFWIPLAFPRYARQTTCAHTNMANAHSASRPHTPPGHRLQARSKLSDAQRGWPPRAPYVQYSTGTTAGDCTMYMCVQCFIPTPELAVSFAFCLITDEDKFSCYAICAPILRDAMRCVWCVRVGGTGYVTVVTNGSAK